MPPRILVNEDSEIDFKLLEAEFKRSSFACQLKRVGTREDFIRALTDYGPELIISDYYLIGFNGLDALEIVKRQAPDIPFVILTNALNEETAVECMKRGATEYVLKNRLPRLVAILQATLERQRLMRENFRIQREYEQLIRLTPDLFCLATLEGIIQVVNPAWTARLGFSSKELIDRPLFTLIHPDDRHSLDSWWSKLVSRTQTAPPFSVSSQPSEFECRMVHRDKGFRYVQWSAKSFPSENKIYAYGHDVTERKLAEQALRESEARFRRMADSAPVLIWMSDTSKAFVYFNRPWLEFTGRSMTDELGSGWVDGVHPEDRERLLQGYEESFAGRTPFRFEYRLRRKDGHFRWVLSHGTPRYDENGTFAGFIGSCFDVTDQHEIEAHLAYRALKQAALAGFGRFALIPRAFTELAHEATRLVTDTLRVERSLVLKLDPLNVALSVEASSGVLIDENLSSVADASHLALEEDRVFTFPEEKAAFPGADLLEKLKAKLGVAIPIAGGKRKFGFLVAISDNGQTFGRDATDFLQGLANVLSTVHQRERAEAALEESEQKLLQSQKMEAVGLLAGGVAHDFNNLLTAIRCYGDILHDDLGAISPELKSKAGEILKATARASALVRQLLAFSRRQVIQPEFMDLNHVVDELKDLLRSLLSENIDFSTQLAEAPVSVEVDRSQIEQVIINLVINARDAMPQGGRLTIRTGTVVVEAGQIADLEAGQYAQLVVLDTGVGMSEDVQAKIFQPFFTTKPKGRGTGLGLATCAVMIKHCRGAIAFRSKLSSGTQFEVYLPLVETPALNLDFEFTDEVGVGTETILLVEDDEAIRAVTAAILRSLGYQVHAMPGGVEALEFVSGGNAPAFDLLLTDIVMPMVSGRELAEQLTAQRPDLRILFMSGYVDDPVIIQAVQEASVPFLEKPFTRDVLAKKVREALDLPRNASAK